MSRQRLSFDGTSKKILAGIALLVIVYGVKSYHKEGDLTVFTRGAENLITGAHIYRNETGAFTYPPFFAFIMMPFTYVKIHTARIMWYLLNILFITLSVKAVKSIVIPSPNEAASSSGGWPSSQAAIVLGFLLTCRFFLSTIDNQQSDLLVLSLSLLGITALEEKRHILCGVLLSAAISIKLTPLLFLPYLVYRRAYTSLISLFACTGVCVLIPEIMFPASSGVPLIVSWYNLVITKIAPWRGGTPWADGGGIWTATNILNQSLSATIYRYVTETPTHIHGGWIRVNFTAFEADTTRIVVYVLSAALLWISSLSMLRNRKAEPQAAVECGIIFCLMLLLSPQSSKPHFSSLLLPYVCLLTEFRKRKDRFLPVTVAVSFLLCTVSSEGFVGKRFSDILEAYGSITLGTVLIWFALLRLRLKTPSTNDRSLQSS